MRVTLLVFFSGFCALVYQVLWERMLRVLVGGGPSSAAIITGTFLLGSGLGAWLFGRSWRKPFHVYAGIEAGIALFALLSHPLLQLLQNEGGLAVASGERLLLRFGVIIPYLILPSLLIGATAPLLYQCFIRPHQAGSSRVSSLYAVNIVGAACGILAVPFVFLPRFAISDTLTITASINLGVALTLLGLGMRPAAAQAHPLSPPVASRLAWTGWTLVFLSGFLSLAYQMCLLRSVSHSLPGSPYAFPITLFLYLLALSAGARWLGCLAVDRLPGLLVLFALTLPLGITMGYSAPIPGLGLLGQLLPVLCIGGIFPLILRDASLDVQRLPVLAGRLTFVNGFGCLTGSLGTQFGMIPHGGTEGALKILVLLTSVSACALSKRKHQRLIMGSLAIAACMWSVGLPAAAWQQFAFGRAVNIGIENRTGTAAVTWETPTTGDLWVNGVYMSQLPRHPRHMEQSILLSSITNRSRVMLLGLGGANILGVLLQDPDVQHITVIEWSTELLEILESPEVIQHIGKPLRDTRVTVIPRDARHVVQSIEPGGFDLIFDNLSWGNWSGATELKSIEYYAQIARLLKPGGVFVEAGNYLFDRLPGTGSTQYDANMAAIQGTFPHVLKHDMNHITFASFADIALSTSRVTHAISVLAESSSLSNDPDWYLSHVCEPVHQPGTEPLHDGKLFYEYGISFITVWKQLLLGGAES